MNKKFEHDQKIHTDEHYPLNLTKNIINIAKTTNMTVFIWPKIIKYDQNDEHEHVNMTKINHISVMFYG